MVWSTPGHERVPDVVDLSPVDAQDSTCMRRGKSLSAGQFTYVARMECWWRQVGEVVGGHR